MKLVKGIIFFPRYFTESQCSDCGKILNWKEVKPNSEYESKCCDKTFYANLNYVNIRIIDEIKKLEDENKET